VPWQRRAVLEAFLSEAVDRERLGAERRRLLAPAQPGREADPERDLICETTEECAVYCGCVFDTAQALEFAIDNGVGFESLVPSLDADDALLEALQKLVARGWVTAATELPSASLPASP